MGCFQSKSSAPPPKSSGQAQPAQPSSDPKPLSQADNNTKVIAQRTPFAVDVVAGKTLYYCTCGRSASQPFCDGKHQGTVFTPLAFTPDATEKVYLCGCKATKNPPKCDGSHQNLRW